MIDHVSKQMNNNGYDSSFTGISITENSDTGRILSGTHSSFLARDRPAMKSQRGPAKISPTSAPIKPEKEQKPTERVLKSHRVPLPKLSGKPAVFATSVMAATENQRHGSKTVGCPNITSGRLNRSAHVGLVGYIGVRKPNLRRRGLVVLFKAGSPSAGLGYKVSGTIRRISQSYSIASSEIDDSTTYQTITEQQRAHCR